MAGARTCAMAANRVIDREIDARNPRTAGRHLPRGAAGRVAAAAAGRRRRGADVRRRRAMLNPLCLALSPLALVFLVGYSYTKRFTWASHWILGFTDGIAAAGGWIAVRGHVRSAGPRAVVRRHRVDRGLRPDLRLPGRRGRPRPGPALGPRALRHARGADPRARQPRAHRAGAGRRSGWMEGLGLFYWVGWLAVVALLVYEHSLVTAARSLAPRRRLLQRQRLHRGDHARGRGHRPLAVTTAYSERPAAGAGPTGARRGWSARCSRASPGATTS